MKEMKTLKFPNQEEAYEIVDAYAREQVALKQAIITGTHGQVIGFGADGNAEAQDMPSDMPEVTTADNGKFLRVVDGAWAAATIANAEGVLF